MPAYDSPVKYTGLAASSGKTDVKNVRWAAWLAANTVLSVHGPHEVALPAGPASEQKLSPIGGGESMATTVWVLVQRYGLN